MDELKVVIDPGHGGSDPGAVANGKNEKDYTLMISQYMFERFNELGVPVTLTRDTDETLSPTERTQRILSAYGNSPDVVVISNHLNAGGGTGAEVIYALRNSDTLARNVLSNLGAEGQTMRKYYQRRLPSDTSKDYYFIHRNTGKTEPIIVEYGFIDDTPENVRFLEDNYKRLAEAVIRAVALYKGIDYIAPPGLMSNTYIVQKGDSLYSIARKYNTTIEELKSLNNLVSNTLQVGQILRVPSEEDTPSSNTYVVQKGDSLYSIARRFNTTVDELKSLNNLTSNVLQINQVLKISEDDNTMEDDDMDTANTYIVQKGDSLYSIAKKFNTTVEQLKSLNNLTSNVLQINQVLKISEDDNAMEDDNMDTANTYVVQSGDSLYSIARKFNTTVDELKSLNNLTSNLLQINQVLKIPSSSDIPTTYTVVAGDNLYSIARKFNTTVDNLKTLNNLTSNLLNIGQKLIIR